MQRSTDKHCAELKILVEEREEGLYELGGGRKWEPTETADLSLYELMDAGPTVRGLHGPT